MIAEVSPDVLISDFLCEFQTSLRRYITHFFNAYIVILNHFHSKKEINVYITQGQLWITKLNTKRSW